MHWIRTYSNLDIIRLMNLNSCMDMLSNRDVVHPVARLIHAISIGYSTRWKQIQGTESLAVLATHDISAFMQSQYEKMQL